MGPFDTGVENLPTKSMGKTFSSSSVLNGLLLGVAIVTSTFRDVSAEIDAESKANGRTSGSLVITDDNWSSILDGQWMVKL